MKIGEFDLEKKVLVIAEIGNNHEGDPAIASELVRQAADCGVDAVKFQTFRAEHYVSKSDTPRFNRLKSFQLSYSQFEKLSQLAHSLGVLFISTPFDMASAEFLEGIVDAYKIASGDNNFYPLLGRIAETNKPVIVSTGLSEFSDVQRTVSFLKKYMSESEYHDRLAILHCVSSYPVPAEQANLRSIQFLAENFDCHIGYSDHTIGLDAAVLAVALGARIIEKHFTLDKNFSDFRDHQISSDPSDLRELVRRIRDATLMLGERNKSLQPCELTSREAMRRSIVAGADLSAGHCISGSDLTWVRPGGGLAPGEEHALIGKRLVHAVRFGDQLNSSDVK